MIYFIESQGMVKIGVSSNPKRRLAMIATGCPGGCVMLATAEGGPEEETRLHELFSHLRRRGEWFIFTDEISKYIAENATPWVEERSSKIDHPLAAFLNKTGQTITNFAERIGMSRMQLYRIMAGESTRTNTLRKISEATGGAVPMSAFLQVMQEPVA